MDRTLFDYIVEKYGDVDNFSRISGIDSKDLSAVLLKDNISNEIGMGLNLCDVLDIDIENMIFDNQIKDSKQENNALIFEITDKSAVKDEIYNRCVRLSEIEKKKVLDYICSLHFV